MDSFPDTFALQVKRTDLPDSPERVNERAAALRKTITNQLISVYETGPHWVKTVLELCPSPNDPLCVNAVTIVIPELVAKFHNVWVSDEVDDTSPYLAWDYILVGKGPWKNPNQIGKRKFVIRLERLVVD